MVALGVSLEDVLWRVTAGPAPVIGLDASTLLAPGAPADLTVYGLRPAAGHQLRDGCGHTVEATQLFETRGVVVNGRIERNVGAFISA